jgi:membrane protein YqaA with SNARE-associated domain
MLEDLGLFGLFLGCFLSATIIPFSSEAILTGALLIGYSPIACLVVATIGNTLGGMTCYYMGYFCKWSWLEKYFHIKKEKIQKFQDKVKKYGNFAGLFCFLPFVGDIIAIAIGFMRFNPYLSCLYMLIGKMLRYVLLIWVYSAVV